MKPKKSSKADLLKNSDVYFLLGLNLVLLLIFIALELTRQYSEVAVKSESIPIIETQHEITYVVKPMEEIPIENVAPPEIPEIPVDVRITHEPIVDSRPLFDQNNLPEVPTYIGTGTSQQTTPPQLPRFDNVDVLSSTVDEPISPRTAKTAMIYPGCEKYKGNNRKLYQCFNEKFSQDISAQLDMFEMKQGEKPQQIQIDFLIDTEGNLKVVKVNDKYISESLKKNAIQAFSRVQQSLQRKADRKKGIVPARDQNNEKATLQYSIPIRFSPSPL